MPNFDVRDAYGSVITIESSVVGGANRQIVTAAITTGNSSVMLLNSSAVAGSITALQGTSPWAVAGSVLAVQGVWSGSVLSYKGTDPWRISSVYGNISGSVLSQQLGTRISSVISSTPSSLLV